MSNKSLAGDNKAMILTVGRCTCTHGNTFPNFSSGLSRIKQYLANLQPSGRKSTRSDVVKLKFSNFGYKIFTLCKNLISFDSHQP